MTPLNSIDLYALWPQSEVDRSLLNELKLWQLRDDEADFQLTDNVAARLARMPCKADACESLNGGRDD
jgi:hypothetical protein